MTYLLHNPRRLPALSYRGLPSPTCPGVKVKCTKGFFRQEERPGCAARAALAAAKRSTLLLALNARSGVHHCHSVRFRTKCAGVAAAGPCRSASSTPPWGARHLGRLFFCGLPCGPRHCASSDITALCSILPRSIRSISEHEATFLHLLGQCLVSLTPSRTLPASPRPARQELRRSVYQLLEVRVQPELVWLRSSPGHLVTRLNSSTAPSPRATADR